MIGENLLESEFDRRGGRLIFEAEKFGQSICRRMDIVHCRRKLSLIRMIFKILFYYVIAKNIDLVIIVEN